MDELREAIVAQDPEGTVYEALEDTAYSPDVYPRHWK